MYKNINQEKYLNKDMIQMGNNNFECVITDHFYLKIIGSNEKTLINDIRIQFHII